MSISTTGLFVHLGIEIPLLLIYLLAIVASIFSKSAKILETGFYSFIAFIGILDVLTYIMTLCVYRLNIYTPFNDFFGGFDEESGTLMTFLYAGTFTLVAARELGTLGLALNRFSAILYNNKKWTLRTFILTVVVCLIGGYACNYYMWDTDVDYMKIEYEDGSAFYFMTLDQYNRDWLNEAAVTLSWTSFCYVLSMATYVLIAFHKLFGGAHPEVDNREFRLTMIAFGIEFCNTFFFFNNIMGYRIDRSDFPVVMKALKQGAPIIPIAHDIRSLCVPLFLVLFDSALRSRLRSPCAAGNEAVQDTKMPLA